VPTANAGPDQTVNAGNTVTLDGSASNDLDDASIPYNYWSQTAGPSVKLSDANSIKPTFQMPSVVPSDTHLTFRLVVRDSALQSQVADNNAPPDYSFTEVDFDNVDVKVSVDFSLNCPNGISALKVGTSGSADCGIHSIGGFNKPVSMSCTAPHNSKLSCNMQPTFVTPPANGDVNTKLTFTAPAASDTPIGDFTLKVTGTSSAAGGGTPITHSADVKVSVV